MIVGLKGVHTIPNYLVYLLVTLVIIVTEVKHHLLFSRQESNCLTRTVRMVMPHQRPPYFTGFCQ